MDEASLRAKYASMEPDYQACLGALKADTHAFFNDKHPTVDVSEVEGRVKELDSILGKLARIGAVTIEEIDDMAAIRVVCFAQSDAQRAVEVLGDYLPTRYQDVKYDCKDTSDGYKAHHFNFLSNTNGYPIGCEIQVKTVMQHAWGVLSHHYLYKKTKEGDADILAKTVAGIFDSCENLWELVKEKKPDKHVDASVSPIAKEVESKVSALQATMPVPVVIAGSFVDRIVPLLRTYGSADKIDLEETIDSEIKKLSELWFQLHRNTVGVEDALIAFEKMESATKDLTLLGLYAIKYDRLDSLKYLLGTFGPLSEISKSQAGLVMSISIPAAILHNVYYYLGNYALAKRKIDAISLLINYEMERANNSAEYFLMPIWSNGSIMTPEINRGADKMFDRLTKNYEKEDERIRTLITTDLEEFTTLSCQFNLLFCLRGQQLIEKNDNRYIWVYPNFGRFYGFRVLPLMQRIIKNPDYSDYPKKLYNLEQGEFIEKASVWINNFEKRGLGSGYWWQSISTLLDDR